MIEKFISLGVLKFGSFVLSSGVESPFYVDMRIVLGHPDLLKWVASRYVEVLEKLKFDVVVGVATGGVPYASVLGYVLNKPIAYVRPEAKAYGTKKRVEGANVDRRDVVVVDDVLTTGKSIIAAIDAVREEGGRVAGAVVFLDREQCGAENVKSSTGVEVFSVFKMKDLLEALRGHIEDKYYRSVVDYLARWRC